MVGGDAASSPSRRGGVALPGVIVQVIALLLFSLVAGSTFGIWRGLGGADFSIGTFIDVHQQLVRGLNVLLPAMGAASAVLVLGLSWNARRNRRALGLYLASFCLILAAAAITRLWNQPINAQVMTWTMDSIPADWKTIQASWWQGHVLRTMFSVLATVAMLLAIFADRNSLPGRSAR